MRFRTLTLYKLNITPQVCFLEKLLNDKYDFVSRRIFIQDAQEQDPIYIYTAPENKPLILYTKAEGKPVTLYTNGEAGALKDDFIVVVPFAVAFNFNEMMALIQTNKLASKQFKIIQQ